MIRVIAHGTIREALGAKEIYFPLPDPPIVETLIKQLKLTGVVGLVIVNGEYKHNQSILKPNDEVNLYPILEGG